MLIPSLRYNWYITLVSVYNKWLNICIHCKTITTVSLVTIITIHSNEMFFLCWELVRFTLLCNTVLLTIATTLYITSPWLTAFTPGISCLLTPSTCLFGNYQSLQFSTSVSLVFVRFHIQVKPYSISLSLTYFT